MAFPRPLDKFVWVEHTSGKQKVIPRSALPELTEEWHRILDPTKKAAPAEPVEPAGDAPAPRKRTQPAKPDSEKE